MKAKFAVGCLTALTTCIAAVPAAGAQAPQPVPCTGPIADQTIDAPVVVPAGAVCSIQRSTLKRGIVAEAGARALALRESKVLLRVSAPSISSFSLVGTKVVGVVDQGGATAAVTVCGTRVVGAARLTANAFALRFGTPALATCDANRVTGVLTVQGNPGASTVDQTTVDGLLRILDNPGPVSLSDVTVNGRLECSGNAEAPIEGEGVRAFERTGQCVPAPAPEPEPTPEPEPAV